MLRPVCCTGAALEVGPPLPNLRAILRLVVHVLGEDGDADRGVAIVVHQHNATVVQAPECGRAHRLRLGAEPTRSQRGLQRLPAQLLRGDLVVVAVMGRGGHVKRDSDGETAQHQEESARSSKQCAVPAARGPAGDDDCHSPCLGFCLREGSEGAGCVHVGERQEGKKDGGGKGRRSVNTEKGGC